MRLSFPQLGMSWPFVDVRKQICFCESRNPCVFFCRGALQQSEYTSSFVFCKICVRHRADVSLALQMSTILWCVWQENVPSCDTPHLFPCSWATCWCVLERQQQVESCFGLLFLLVMIMIHECVETSRSSGICNKNNQMVPMMISVTALQIIARIQGRASCVRSCLPKQKCLTTFQESAKTTGFFFSLAPT